MTTKSHVIVHNNIPAVAVRLSNRQLNKLGERIGAMFERALVERIHGGDSRWAPLSPAWAEEKGHGRQWYYTGATEGAMEYEVDNGVVRIGIIGDGEIASVAVKLEYGDSSIPARPLFRPVYQENKKEILADAGKWIKAQVAKGKI